MWANVLPVRAVPNITIYICFSPTYLLRATYGCTGMSELSHPGLAVFVSGIRAPQPRGMPPVDRNAPPSPRYTHRQAMPICVCIAVLLTARKIPRWCAIHTCRYLHYKKTDPKRQKNEIILRRIALPCVPTCPEPSQPEADTV